MTLLPLAISTLYMLHVHVRQLTITTNTNRSDEWSRRRLPSINTYSRGPLARLNGKAKKITSHTQQARRRFTFVSVGPVSHSRHQLVGWLRHTSGDYVIRRGRLHSADAWTTKQIAYPSYRPVRLTLADVWLTHRLLT